MPTADMPELEILFARFGMALFLGFLIGLEREREKGLIFAGMRTFALISLLGALLAFISEQLDQPFFFLTGFVLIAIFGMLSYLRGFEGGHVGITTEIVSMLAFLFGAMVYWDMLTLAAALTVVVVLILSFKPNLQSFLKNVNREDIRAGLQFAIVWVIVLPILPNQTYDPLEVLNPREIWFMVVFVAGLNLASYVLSQLFGARLGISLTGVLGGMISSTAVTYEFAHRSKSEDERQYSEMFALAIVIASTGMYFRIPLLALFFNTNLGIALIIPMLVGGVVCGLGIVYLGLRLRQGNGSLGEPDSKPSRSPFALRPALQFGLLFAAILLFSKTAQVVLGETGTYLSSIIGGIGGLDAVTLSLAKLASNGTSEKIAMRGVALGAGSNMLFKGGVAYMIGTDAVRRQVLPIFIIAAVLSVGTAFLLT